MIVSVVNFFFFGAWLSAGDESVLMDGLGVKVSIFLAKMHAAESHAPKKKKLTTETIMQDVTKEKKQAQREKPSTLSTGGENPELKKKLEMREEKIKTPFSEGVVNDPRCMFRCFSWPQNISLPLGVSYSNRRIKLICKQP
jgi:hypothetical protein